MTTRFTDLAIGQTFDWIDDAQPSANSFFLRCTKISPRAYRDERGATHRVGWKNAAVFHVGLDAAESDASLPTAR